MHLIIQHTEQTVDIGIFEASQCYGAVAIEKANASSLLIPRIDELLNSTHNKLSDLTFIGTNAGPGPFTTLRTILATVNGLGYATHIPLIGIDGLDAMLDVACKRNNASGNNHSSGPGRTLVALFNAFSGDLYFGIEANGERRKGWKPHKQLFDELKAEFNQNILFVGSGVVLYKDLIIEMFGASSIPTPLPLNASLATLNHRALQLFEQKQTQDQLLPLYLKTQTVINKTVHFV